MNTTSAPTARERWQASRRAERATRVLGRINWTAKHVGKRVRWCAGHDVFEVCDPIEVEYASDRLPDIEMYVFDAWFTADPGGVIAAMRGESD